MKFTPSGGRVTLSLRAGLADARTARSPTSSARTPCPSPSSSVSDTGIGIPAGEQGKLFTRFFRASTAQRNAVPGVGLGLTITKAITTAHGGTLDVVSAEGEGTTFTLTLPRAHRPDPAALRPSTLPGTSRPRRRRDATSRSVARPVRRCPRSSAGIGPIGGFLPKSLRIPCGTLAGDLRLRPPEFVPVAGNARRRHGHRETQDMTTKNRTSRPAPPPARSSARSASSAPLPRSPAWAPSVTSPTAPPRSPRRSSRAPCRSTCPSRAYAVPVTTTGFVPGDSITRAVNLVNDGNSALGSVTLTSTRHRLQRPHHRPHQRPAAGGEVAARSPWTQGGTATAPPTPARAPRRSIGSGPVVNNMALNNPASPRTPAAPTT